MDITAWAIGLMELLGGPGTALVIAAEAIFPPIPGEILLPFAGVAAASDGQNVLVPLTWTTAGSVIGGLGVYAVGRGLGLRRTRAVIARLPLLEQGDVDAALRFFDRWGFPAVVIARFVPMVRTFISIPAGIERMHVGLFALATGLGSGIWNAVFVTAGYVFGQAGGDALESFVRLYSVAVAGLGLLAAIGFCVRRLRDRRRARRSPRRVPPQGNQQGSQHRNQHSDQHGSNQHDDERGTEPGREHDAWPDGEHDAKPDGEHDDGPDGAHGPAQPDTTDQPRDPEPPDRTGRPVRNEPSAAPDPDPHPAPTLEG
ncbi:VTT domain-containing protein [Brachybacterium sp. 107]|uniref:VTT domain-containing protein n=1 Tax=Brachybacterium sp. 107 TaxID=3457736 RepID=UPI004034DA85